MNRSASTLVALAGFAIGAAAQTDIYWNAGSGNWSLAANWNPQNVPNAVDENALIQGPIGITVTQDLSLSIHALGVGTGVELLVPGNRTLSLSAGALNDGLIRLNPTGSVYDGVLNFAADGALDGAGTVRLMAGASDSEVMTAPGVTLTNRAGHTIDGAGSLTAMLVNEGLVLASDTGMASQLSVRGYDKTNNGAMEAGTDATLEITGMTLTQGSSGVLHARDGGTVKLTGSQTLVGGRMTADPGGTLLRAGSGNTTLNGIAIEADLLVEPNSNLYCVASAMAFPGRIVLHPSTSSYNSFLDFNADCTASGGGSIYLAGPHDDCWIQTTNDATLTVGPDFSIDGAGSVTASLVNNGEITALPTLYTAGPMVLSGFAKTNNAVMQAGTDGVLRITSVAITQGPAGVILADGGTVEFTGNPSITGGTLDAVNGGTLSHTESGTLTLNDVTLDGDLDVRANNNVTSGGATLVNNATMFVNNSTSTFNSVLTFNADCAVSGTGTFFLGGSENDSQISSAAGVTVTHGASHTIAGSGYVNAAVVNNGTFRADPGDVGNGRLYLRTRDKTNNATMIGGPGGELVLSGITLTQGPTGVLLADGGEVEFDQTSQAVVGGTLDAINGGRLVKEGGGTLTLTGVTIDADLEIRAGTNAATTGPTLVNNAVVVINDSTSPYNGVFTFNDTCAVSGTGAFFLGGGASDSQLNTGAGAVATLGPGIVVEGSGYVSAQLINNGRISAVPTDSGGARLTLRVEHKTNDNLISAEPDAVLEVSGITLTQTGPGVLLADGGTVELTGTVGVTGGRFDSSGDGLVRTDSGASLTLDGVINDGSFHVGPNTQATVVSDPFVNNGLVRVNDTTSAYNGVLRFSQHTAVLGAGTIRMGGIGADSQILAPDVGASLVLGVGQTIEGEGYLDGSFLNGGTIRPGLPSGKIVGPATVEFEPTGVLEIQAEGDPGAHGWLELTGPLTLDGTLRFRFLGGHTPTIFPAVYRVATASTLDGKFAVLDLPAPVRPGTAVYAGHDGTAAYVAFTCLSDNAPPYGVLDLSDINAFVAGFLAHDPVADLDGNGVYDLGDINAFVASFLAGCTGS
jgi:hypothetical protein